MTQEVQFSLNLLAACLMRQHQALERIDARLNEILDRVDAIGDLVWKLKLSDANATAAPLRPDAMRLGKTAGRPKRRKVLAQAKPSRKGSGTRTSQRPSKGSTQRFISSMG